MNINLYLLLFVILFGLFLSLYDKKRNRLIYIVLCSAVFIFVAAMRSPEWMTYTYGIDTLNYKYKFEVSFDIGWDEFWKTAYLRYFEHYDEVDVGYIAFNKIIGLFTNDFHIFSLVADLVFFVPFGIILYRYTYNMCQIMFAFVFYIALIQIFLFGGGRQMFALGLDMMALLSIIDKKRFLAILLVLLGISLHFSSILFLIPLLMISLSFRPLQLKIIHLICFLMIPIVLIMPNQFIVFMGDVVGLEKYSNYGLSAVQGGTTTFIFLIEMLSFFCLIAIKKQDLLSHKFISIFYVMAPLFTLFAPLVRSNGTMIRLSLYFYFFLVLLVPYSIDSLMKGRERYFAYIIAIGALSFLSLYSGGVEYYFFWDY